jgi:hypothetical protein
METKSSVELLRCKMIALTLLKLNQTDRDIMEHFFKQAKEMHKQEIIEAYRFGLKDEYVIGSQRYYNETFAQIGGHSEIPTNHTNNGK